MYIQEYEYGSQSDNSHLQPLAFRLGVGDILDDPQSEHKDGQDIEEQEDVVYDDGTQRVEDSPICI